MWVLFFVQIINRLGDFVAPFLTLFLTKKLSLPDSEAGLYVSLTVASGLAGIMVSGRISDRRGRKPVLVAGMVVSAFMIGISGFFTDCPLIIAFLVAMTFFQGMVRPSVSALIADLTRPDERKDAYALNYLGINVGVAVGPMIAGFLFEHSIEWLFWADALTSVVAALLIILFIPAQAPAAPAEADAAGGDEKAAAGNPFGAFLARPYLVAFCLIFLVIQFMYSQIHFAIPLAVGAVSYGMLSSFNAVIVVSVTPVANRFTRRLYPLVSMGVGAILYAVGFGMMALPLTPPFFFVSTLIWTLGEILFSINTGVHMAAKTPRNLRGQFQSYLEFASSLGKMAGPFVGGLVTGHLGISWLWVIVGILGIGAAAGFLSLQRAERKVL